MKTLAAMAVLASIALFAVSGCGRRDEAPPVATPTVTLAQNRVALGGALSVTYRFQVAPNASFDKNYRVLVHVLDANDELLWTEDHEPPVPTREWKAGQTVEYTLVHFVPIYPYVGEAVMTVGLYAADSIERLPLTGENTGQREYVVGRFQLLPQTESVLIVFKDGWHPAERAADNPAVEWQWTKQNGLLSFRNPRRNATFYLHYGSDLSMVDAPQTVTVYLQDQVVDTFTVDSPDDTIRTLELKAAQFGSDDMAHVRLSVDPTFIPAVRQPGNGDPRELGIRVFHAVLEAP